MSFIFFLYPAFHKCIDYRIFPDFPFTTGALFNLRKKCVRKSDLCILIAMWKCKLIAEVEKAPKLFISFSFMSESLLKKRQEGLPQSLPRAKRPLAPSFGPIERPIGAY